MTFYFENLITVFPEINVIYQLLSFSEALNCSCGSVAYLCRLANGIATVSIVFANSKMVLRLQKSWPITRRELVAAVTTTELSKQAFDALGLLSCSIFLM